MDLYGRDRGNVSLPARLQPRDFDETKLRNIIVNTQEQFYDLKLGEIQKRIQRLEERNEELEDKLVDTDYFIKSLEAEKAQEILNLNKQVASQASRIDEYKKQLMTVAKSRIDNKIAHIANVVNINDKYKNTKLALTSQMKLLSARTNVLEDYKLMQDVLRKKLDTQNQLLIYEREQVEENLGHIERKSENDREKLKEDLYNGLLDLAGIFQVEVARHMPRSISKLLSENIAISNNLLTITNSITLKEQDCRLRRTAVKEYKRRNKKAQLNAKQSTVTSKLERSAIAMLRESRSKANVQLSKLTKPDHLTEEQYIINKDKAAIEARKCETRVKYLEISLYCEQEKLAIAKFRKQWISEQNESQMQMLYDIKRVLMNMKVKNDCELKNDEFCFN